MAVSISIIPETNIGGDDDLCVPDERTLQPDPWQITGTAVLVSVQTPPGTTRTPCDICCVIDTSWSMSMEAKVQNATASESGGLSMLDIAKHAVQTVIHTLGDQDRLSIVEFCRENREVLPLTWMDAAGRKKASNCLNDLVFGGGTRLWGGIERGLKCFSENAQKDRFGHIMVLTDGETENYEDVMHGLQEYKAKFERLPCTISAFGFGYEIDAELLVEIADFCNGSYAFIPDAGFVGTIFVNSISNLLTSFARDARLSIQAEEGAEIVDVIGGWQSSTTKGSDGVYIVDLGVLQCGQSRDIVFRIKATNAVAPYLFAALECSAGSTKLTCEAEGKILVGQPDVVSPHVNRSHFVDVLNGITEMLPHREDATEAELAPTHELLQRLAKVVASSVSAHTDRVKALLEDILGQCSEAVSKDSYWNKWGKHYIASVGFAHQLQQCNNFKDPGVQFYGGRIFQDLQETADSAFNKLPAPQVTPAKYVYMGQGKLILNPNNVAGSTPAAPAAGSINMAAYNDRYAGCIDGESVVQLACGETKKVAELAKGDKVMAAGGSAEVDCVVEMRCPSGKAVLVQLSENLRITAYHPVFVNDVWRFPIEVQPAAEFPCRAVYCVVLRGAPAMLVGNIAAVALGHGLSEGAAAHPYFASELVLKDLQKLPGYASGRLGLKPNWAQRDPLTGLVCGMIAEPLADRFA